MQRRADARFAATPLELRGDHARIVEHQHIACAQQPRQVAHAAILERPVVAHHEHARGIARPRWTQRDPFGRKFEIEKVDFHRAAPSPGAA